jgi:hypothetical protein
MIPHNYNRSGIFILSFGERSSIRLQKADSRNYGQLWGY